MLNELGPHFAAKDQRQLGEVKVTANLMPPSNFPSKRQPVMKHPQCQGCCWCAPGGAGGREQLSRTLCGTFQGAAHIRSPCHPAPTAGTPTRLARHTQKALFLRSSACLPTRLGLGSPHPLRSTGPLPQTCYPHCLWGVWRSGERDRHCLLLPDLSKEL